MKPICAVAGGSTRPDGMSSVQVFVAGSKRKRSLKSTARPSSRDKGSRHVSQDPLPELAAQNTCLLTDGNEAALKLWWVRICLSLITPPTPPPPPLDFYSLASAHSFHSLANAAGAGPMRSILLRTPTTHVRLKRIVRTTRSAQASGRLALQRRLQRGVPGAYLLRGDGPRAQGAYLRVVLQ